MIPVLQIMFTEVTSYNPDYPTFMPPTPEDKAGKELADEKLLHHS